MFVDLLFRKIVTIAISENIKTIEAYGVGLLSDAMKDHLQQKDCFHCNGTVFVSI